VDQQYRGTRAGDSERTPVAVDGAKLQGGRQLSHRAQIGLSGLLRCCHLANFVVGPVDGLIAVVPVFEAFFSLVPGRKKSFELGAELVTAGQILVARQQ
jgi:hypothetical protein